MALAKLQQPIWRGIIHSFLKQNFKHYPDKYVYETVDHQVFAECVPTISASHTGLALCVGEVSSLS